METFLDATRLSGPSACREVLLVGSDNPLSTEPQYALYHEPRGCSGHRLQSKILGLRSRQHYLPIWRTNLCVGGWDPRMALDRAAQLVGQARPWRVVVMLGAKVGDAFARAVEYRYLDEPLTMTQRSGESLKVACRIRGGEPTDTMFIALPHPSGRNTTWNDPGRVAQARSLLAAAAPDVPWGETDEDDRIRTSDERP